MPGSNPKETHWVITVNKDLEVEEDRDKLKQEEEVNVIKEHYINCDIHNAMQ